MKYIAKLLCVPLLLAGAAPLTAQAASSPVNGTYKLTLSITATTVPATTNSITCDVNLDVETDGGDSIQESVTGTAVQTSGVFYKCTLTLPYSWQNLAATTGTVYINYDVNLAGTTANRTHTRALPSISIPATNSTTSQTDSLKL
ncbi:MAG TPA: hypothetical protein VKS60_02485 [Stellaceae bacterium]|nr:hypothetical protein [Stellaceae bacterium]